MLVIPGDRSRHHRRLWCGWYADIEVADVIVRARGFPRAQQLASHLGVVDPPWTYLVGHLGANAARIDG